MNSASDLFLPEEKKDQKARRSVAEIIAEDNADLARLAELSETKISYRKLSALKSSCAWALLHKKTVGTVLSAIVIGTIVLFQVPGLGRMASFQSVAALEVNANTQSLETLKVELEPNLPEVKLPSELDLTPAAAEYQDQSLVLYDHNNDAQGSPLQSDELAHADPSSVPATANDGAAGEHMDNVANTVPATADITVGTVAVPINQINVHEDKAPSAGETPSASDFIDQFGFGTDPKPEPEPSLESASEVMVNDNGDDVSTGTPVPLPMEKPQDNSGEPASEAENIRYRIVDRDGENAGFRRMKDQKPETTQWFLVIEAIGSDDKPIPMPVMSMDTGKISKVPKWAVQVSEQDFMKFSDEKKKTGKIKNTVIGTAPSNETEPDWAVKLTGNMLTEWE